jgi:hypothetical protein
LLGECFAIYRQIMISEQKKKFMREKCWKLRGEFLTKKKRIRYLWLLILRVNSGSTSSLLSSGMFNLHLEARTDALNLKDISDKLPKAIQ